MKPGRERTPKCGQTSGFPVVARNLQFRQISEATRAKVKRLRTSPRFCLQLVSLNSTGFSEVPIGFSSSHRFGSLWVICATLWLPAFAGPANPEPVAITQPDGTVFQPITRGDEFQGWMETADGYTVLRNPATGFFDYAVRSAVGAYLGRPGGEGSVRMS